jgi:sulfonate transport system ATP-binding protein
LSRSIELKRVSKRHAGSGEILAGIDLTIGAGEIVSIVGPSGCGKSTLLRIVAGLDRVHGGQVAVDGRPVLGPGRDVGLIFQEPRLLPWLTVERNVAFGLGDAVPAPERRAAARRLLSQVRLRDAAELFPRQLSGGMAQRAAIARALAARPSVLLLDEPFCALDAFTRLHLQDLLLEVWEEARATMLLVTHEVDEALYLSDRVIVLGPRPARIAESLRIGLPRPRDRRDPELVELRAHLLSVLHLVGAGDRAARDEDFAI